MYETNNPCNVLLEQNVCRTCLFSGAELTNAFDVVFDEDCLVNILKHHLIIEIKQNDTLPKVLCKNCIHEVHRIHNFINKSKRSESQLLASDTNLQSILNKKTQKAINFQNKKVEVIANCERDDLNNLGDSGMLSVSDQNIEGSNNSENKLLSIIDIKNKEQIYDETNSETFSISVTASDITLNVISEKSREKYENAYKRFKDYCQGNYSEKLMLSYFVQLSKSLKAPTLWSNYSMLRATLNIKENVDIAQYLKLKAFLKRKARGYKGKKSRILNMEQIQRFISEAPDETFLVTKIALIFGVSGACHHNELANMKVSDIKDLGTKLLINLPANKRNITRSFFIVNEDYLEIYRKYSASRPINFDCSRFFFKYAKGKGCKQPIGLHTFGRIPKIVAGFLKLPNPSEFTGHCLRRTGVNVASEINMQSMQNFEFVEVEVNNEPKTSCKSDINNLEDESILVYDIKSEVECETVQIEKVVNCKIKTIEDVNNCDELHSILDIKTEVDETEWVDAEVNDSNENFEDLSDVEETMETQTLSYLPLKSREKYEKTYKRFMDICQGLKPSENLVLGYFMQLSKSQKAPTLWAHFSMLKKTLFIREKIDISKYLKLCAFLKRQSDGYKAKKPKILNMEQIRKFISEAPDKTFLLAKVALIFFAAGACRREELAYMKVEDIEDLGSSLLINVPGSKKAKARSFFVNEIYLEIYRKYTTFRPLCADTTSRFFFKYVKGKGYPQPVGVNQFGRIPKIVATFLNLANPTEYSGHSFRHCSATI